MFTRWGAFVYRFRRPFVVGSVALALVMGFFGLGASSHLSSGGWLDTTSESAKVDLRLASEFGGGKSNIIALFRSSISSDATSPAFQAAIAQTLAPLAGDPDITGIVGYAQTKDPRFISSTGSTAGSATYVVIQLNATDEQSVDLVAGIRAKLSAPAGFTYQLTGYGPITKDAAGLSEKDLVRAETISLPIVAFILILVFASLVAAAMPLLVAGLAIPTTLGLIYFVSRQIEMSVYVINIATMLGLALAIDYSLFIVSRFREELARGRTVGEAVEKAVATSGKAVTFSGFAVAIGLSGLLLFKSSAISSIGVAGSLVVIGTLVYALTFLPATLGMLGPRVNALSLGGLFRRLGWHPSANGGHRWERVARVVMRRPVYVLVPVLALLFLVGSPFFRLVQGVPDASIYPAGMESRDAYIALQSEFATGETTPVIVLATVQGDPTSAANATALAAYANELAGLNGVTKVESPYSLTDPTSGVALTPAQVGALYAMPAASRPPQVAAAIAALQQAYVRGSTVRLNAVSKLDPALPESTSMVPTVRALPVANGITTQVGGESAIGHDFLVAQGDRMPYAIGLTLIASAIVLFLLFGSLAIPIKAVFMTLLSISASFGALVWIFQDGNLSNILHFTPLPYTIAGNPIIMFSVIFGLSMDYEVLLLSRIQEAYRRTADNTAAVAEGLARTASVITGAALIMVCVFASFALADTITIKTIGVGMAIAVFLDATIVRVLLVPATMRLLGHWNWWAPGPLQRFADRLGFDHTEDAEPVPASGPTMGGAVG
jgi:putative drug exporter of the RND superfamily